MPKAINYKANSVIYFSSDVSDRVFLLKSGNIAITYIDIETDAQVTDYIKTGEFFGVKSVLGNYPREESAMVLTDSVVYAFTGPEFETFAAGNPRIILQMIKIFSKQLRKVHAQIQSLTKDTSSEEGENSKSDISNDDGLFSVAEAFFNSRHYNACTEVCRRYAKLYKNGKHINEIKRFLIDSQGAEGLNFGAAEQERAATIIETPSVNRSESIKQDAKTAFSLARSSEEEGNFEEAYQKYYELNSNEDAAIANASVLGAGRCLFKAGDFVGAIQFLTAAITQNPRTPHIGEMLLYVGMSYEKSGKQDKALAFYTKASSLAANNPELGKKIAARIQSIKGGANA